MPGDTKIEKNVYNGDELYEIVMNRKNEGRGALICAIAAAAIVGLVTVLALILGGASLKPDQWAAIGAAYLIGTGLCMLGGVTVLISSWKQNAELKKALPITEYNVPSGS